MPLIHEYGDRVCYGCESTASGINCDLCIGPEEIKIMFAKICWVFFWAVIVLLLAGVVYNFAMMLNACVNGMAYCMCGRRKSRKVVKSPPTQVYELRVVQDENEDKLVLPTTPSRRPRPSRKKRE
jgi:hypothetical protein